MDINPSKYITLELNFHCVLAQHKLLFNTIIVSVGNLSVLNLGCLSLYLEFFRQ